MLSQFLRAAGGASGELKIEYVGGRVVSSAGTTSNINIDLTTLAGGLDSAPAAGDFVLVYFGTGSVADRDLVIAGYTEVTELYTNDTEHTNLAIGYKFMPATPDTSFTLTGGSLSTADACAVYVSVWRNVDPIIPFDVLPTTSTIISSVLANPPAITPVTSGSYIIAGGAGGHTAGAQTYSSSNLTSFLTAGSNDENDVTIGGGYNEWTSGSFDPAAFTFSSSNSTAFSNASATLAIRPARNYPSEVVGITRVSVNVTEQVSITTPAGTASGDYLVTFIMQGSNTVSTPAGWTLLASDTSFATGKIYAFGRLLTSAPAGSYTFTFSGSTSSIVAAMITLRGVTSASVDNAGDTATTSSTTITAPSRTPASPGILLSAFAIEEHAIITIPSSSIALSYNINPSTLARRAMAVGIESISAGATGTRVATSNIAGNNIGATVIVTN